VILNFAEALAQLGPNAAAQIANSARPPENYLFNTFLPERQKPDYNIDATNMIVKTTMAGLAAMDSPYPPGGAVTISNFLERTAKIAITNRLLEATIRELQLLLRQMQYGGTLTNTYLQQEALNFLQKVVVQAHLDRSEWLRGQALVNGEIDWTFNQKNLLVNYGIPAGNFLTERTDSSNDAYGDTSSAFWADVAEARRLLRYALRAAILNSITLDEIVSNPVNNLEIINQTDSLITVRRFKTVGGNTVPDSDARYTITFIIYDEEAEILDLTPSSTNATSTVKFMPDGKIIYVGENRMSGYRVGTGSTDDPANALELGYHHIAPTVEGGGNPGRWARLFVPQDKPMHLQAEGASNELPVILAPQKIVVATTEILG
jgi:Phage major capsid protein E